MFFERSPASLKEVETLLASHGAHEALIKPLSKNHNDKNQIYSGSDFRPLFPTFDMKFSFRGASTSRKKGSKTKGQAIPEAVFRRFVWVDASGREIPARNVKMIIYAQYPETRLSGFQTVDNTMPEAMSVEFTKRYPDVPRYLVLGRRGSGEAVAVMVADPANTFMDEVAELPNATGSRVWKHLRLRATAPARLISMLAGAAGRPMPGCRLDSAGRTLPFNGTQVCGYTLEHALGIVPNSDKHGDFEGIELKTHTQKKVTLFTPEPDMGLYSENFDRFMEKHGYLDGSGHYRLTGIHRVGIRCDKSGLTLEVKNHDRGTTLASSADKGVHLALTDDNDELAAGWSLDRILNCWTSKHNEAVYIPATKSKCTDKDLKAEGYGHLVEFSDQVMWCRETSAEQLFEALYNGTLFLDPAPKFCPGNPKLNKRRSQWRVNDIAAAAHDLYTDVRIIALSDELAG
ncbi:MvaI/BcnI family restriction endonuclease [Ruegeria aquimaris]|uniref:MvaI/BcnI family restriction endonuclease n=1 Tax=Ruegeria aquimaris TaxID=2984333 RepID=A0ABT3AL78_9RHOB|nr:MvaI/BcnI family restriction endonuclease [Ruegeria sp. XHP0148]MCV2889445.1 MvaI/BcnI family restriction endonuclease [Ruegeria sp. XHP0148]